MTDQIITADPAVADAAARLAEAELQAEAATQAAREAEALLHKAQARQAELDAERRAIGARRADGDTRPDDAQVLALLMADGEALSDVIARHEHEVAVARAQAQQAVRVLCAARHALAIAEAEALERGLTEFLAAADAAVAEAVARLHDAVRAQGRGVPKWLPSERLMMQLQPLYLQRGL